jgi:hypothetical protein
MVRRSVLAAAPLLALAVAVAPAACGGRTEATIDAGVGDADSLEGMWDVTWTCEHRCFLPEPSLTHSRVLNVHDGLLAWRDDVCVECVTDHVPDVRAACIGMPLQSEDIEEIAAYAVCAGEDDTLSVTVSARHFGGVAQSSIWRGVGHRR